MKSIIITGASSGIGAATAQRFLSEGWIVGLVARRQPALIEVANGAQNAVVLPCDVTDEAQVKRAFGQFVDRAGHLNSLFNNAGQFGPSGSLDEIELTDWRATIDLNVTAMFLCAKSAFGQMRHQSPQGGRIINNGSLSAHAPRTPFSAAYTTSKHAISGLTKTITMDGRPFDIACGQIDIGNAATPLVRSISESEGDTPMTMDVSHCADAVWQMANLPLSANVQSMTIMATKMPFVGRG
ncbi:SDR family oxidoreductase [Aestuariibius sp. HNIBRBA575]|uniref:SDR family oxidoreductase n=1 Tax=Aestuariibius sp. HNIBRBA575 TaxID=3233343 RepID=UPI0034A41658